MPSEPIHLNVLRGLISALILSVEVIDMDKKSEFTKQGKFLTKNTTVSGLKVTGEYTGNDVRISNDLIINFQSHKIIFPFKFWKNIFNNNNNNNNNNGNIVAIIYQ